MLSHENRWNNALFTVNYVILRKKNLTQIAAFQGF
jgi:hypothetical protein